ncbi:MAG TPA: hypothetical protein VK909_00850 [Anaerolineales bacterium]|nr:hypothetical protein [Anaerolineales bacterium]
MKLIQFLLPRLEYVLFIAVFWGIAASGPKLLNFDGDLPRHLLVGQLIRETKRIPLTDTFSFRTQGFPAIPHEWLSQVILSITNDVFGLSGVVLLTALIVMVTWAIVYGEGSRRSTNLFTNLAVTATGIAASMLHVLPRPHLFTYLFTALWIVVLERINKDKPNAWWLLPALMLLWVNLHGMFVLGIMIWGIYLIGSLLENPSRSWLADPSTRAMLLGGVFSGIATFISPSGIHIWASIISLGSNAYITSRIPEYQSANFHLPETWPFILLVVLAIISLARNANKTLWTYVLLVSSFAAFALYSSRMIPLFAIIAVPVVSKSVSEWVHQEYPNSRFSIVERNFSKLNSSSDGLIWPFVIFIAMVFILKSGGTIDPQGRGNRFDSSFFPVQAVDWLNSHPQQGHMFNEFDWGGYLLLNLHPRRQIFMDGHTHIYGEALTREYETVITSGSGWQAILDKYRIQWAILRTNAYVARSLEAVGWKIVYQDDTAVILHQP